MALWRSPVRARYGPRKGQSGDCPFFYYEHEDISMIPTQIKLSSNHELSITWDDGHAGVISLNTLRDHCPCAGCQGETILLKTYKPEPQRHLPGRYNLSGIQQVGNYAIEIAWGDGHRTGIYTWALLRNLCECPTCRARNDK